MVKGWSFVTARTNRQKRETGQGQPHHAERASLDSKKRSAMARTTSTLWFMEKRILEILQMAWRWSIGRCLSHTDHRCRYGKLEYWFNFRQGASKRQRREKKGTKKAVGLSRGGLNTKIHAIVDGLGNPVEFILSPGNDHDSIHAINLLSKIEIKNSNILADKAYGTEAIRNYIKTNGADYVIPPKINNPNPWSCDWYRYKERHLVECFFQKIKWFRRIATRYDKLDKSFICFVFLAAMVVLLK